MRRARLLLCALSVAVLAAAPSHATTITVVIAGTWDSVVDNASVTNGTLTVGGTFSATFVYDDAASDLDPTVNVGDYLLPATTTDLVLSSGSYTFSLLSTSPVSLGIDNNVGGQDGFGFFAEYFTTSGPLVAGASTGYGYANPALFDNSQTAHSSDDLTGLPWDASAYDNASFYFLIAVLGKGANKYIELSGTITSLTVLPEPSFVTLSVIGLSALLIAHRRG